MEIKAILLLLYSYLTKYEYSSLFYVIRSDAIAHLGIGLNEPPKVGS